MIEDHKEFKTMKNKEIAEKLLRSINDNTLPWRKTWKNDGKTIPYNPITKTVYKGMNAFNLYFDLLIKTIKDPSLIADYRFSTFNQLKKQSLHLNKGSKGHHISYYSTVEYQDENNEPKTKAVLKQYVVFNYSNVTIPEELQNKFYQVKQSCLKVSDSVKKIIDKLGVKIVVSNVLEPCYIPDANVIHLPETFDSDNAKYGTLFHEIAHWTKNNIEKCKRSLSYAQEELVAEISSFMICHDLGIEYNPKEMSEYYAYLKSWLSNFNTDEEKLEKLDESLSFAGKILKEILGSKNDADGE